MVAGKEGRVLQCSSCEAFKFTLMGPDFILSEMESCHEVWGRRVIRYELF